MSIPTRAAPEGEQDQEPFVGANPDAVDPNAEAIEEDAKTEVPSAAAAPTIEDSKRESTKSGGKSKGKSSYGSGSNSYATPKYSSRYQSRHRRKSSKKPDTTPAPKNPCECNFYDTNRQQIYQSPCQLGVIPMRSAAFQAPRIPLPKLCNHLLPPAGDSDGDSDDGVNFAFKPQTHCRTEVTFVIEPKPQPPWLTMLNCGFKPMVNCSAPPCYLSPNGNPGTDFMGGQQSVVNRCFGTQMQYSGMANFPTLNQIQGQFPGGRIIDASKHHGSSSSSSSEDGSSSSEESSEDDHHKIKHRGGPHNHNHRDRRQSRATAGTRRTQHHSRRGHNDSNTTTSSSGHHHKKDDKDNYSRSSDWH